MQRPLLFVAILALTASLCDAQISTWVPDKAHSEVDFSVDHLNISSVRGTLGIVDGSIQINDEDITRSNVNITIDMNSVNSALSVRDSVLKSTSFFNVAQYPTATFVSTSVVKSPAGITVTGNLTLRGVTKPAVLQVEDPKSPMLSTGQKPRRVFLATTTMSRTAFGIATSYPPAVIGDEVKLHIDLEVTKH